ncbi:hypothetical protein M8J75_002136 [Diaphorina citri]|nr:hypothetical protein M8J75_002136 [Diaphorina citri]
MKISIVFMLSCIAITTTSASFNNSQKSAAFNNWSDPSSSFNKQNIIKGRNNLIEPFTAQKRSRNTRDRRFFSHIKPGTKNQKSPGLEKRKEFYPSKPKGRKIPIRTIFRKQQEYILTDADLPIKPLGINSDLKKRIFIHQSQPLRFVTNNPMQEHTYIKDRIPIQLGPPPPFARNNPKNNFNIYKRRVTIFQGPPPDFITDKPVQHTLKYIGPPTFEPDKPRQRYSNIKPDKPIQEENNNQKKKIPIQIRPIPIVPREPGQRHSNMREGNNNQKKKIPIYIGPIPTFEPDEQRQRHYNTKPDKPIQEENNNQKKKIPIQIRPIPIVPREPRQRHSNMREGNNQKKKIPIYIGPIPTFEPDEPRQRHYNIKPDKPIQEENNNQKKKIPIQIRPIPIVPREPRQRHSNMREENNNQKKKIPKPDEPRQRHYNIKPDKPIQEENNNHEKQFNIQKGPPPTFASNEPIQEENINHKKQIPIHIGKPPPFATDDQVYENSNFKPSKHIQEEYRNHRQRMPIHISKFIPFTTESQVQENGNIKTRNPIYENSNSKPGKHIQEEYRNHRQRMPIHISKFIPFTTESQVQKNGNIKPRNPIYENSNFKPSKQVQEENRNHKKQIPINEESQDRNTKRQIPIQDSSPYNPSEDKHVKKKWEMERDPRIPTIPSRFKNYTLNHKVVMKISIVFMLICIAITTTSASPLFNNWQESVDLDRWSNPSSSFNKLNKVKGNNKLNAQFDVLNRKTRDIHSSPHLKPGKKIEKSPVHEQKLHPHKEKILTEADLPIKPIGIKSDFIKRIFIHDGPPPPFATNKPEDNISNYKKQFNIYEGSTPFFVTDNSIITDTNMKPEELQTKANKRIPTNLSSFRKSERQPHKKTITQKPAQKSTHFHRAGLSKHNNIKTSNKRNPAQKSANFQRVNDKWKRYRWTRHPDLDSQYSQTRDSLKDTRIKTTSTRKPAQKSTPSHRAGLSKHNRIKTSSKRNPTQKSTPSHRAGLSKHNRIKTSSKRNPAQKSTPSHRAGLSKHNRIKTSSKRNPAQKSTPSHRAGLSKHNRIKTSSKRNPAQKNTHSHRGGLSKHNRIKTTTERKPAQKSPFEHPWNPPDDDHGEKQIPTFPSPFDSSEREKYRRRWQIKPNEKILTYPSPFGKSERYETRKKIANRTTQKTHHP